MTWHKLVGVSWGHNGKESFLDFRNFYRLVVTQQTEHLDLVVASGCKQ